MFFFFFFLNKIAGLFGKVLGGFCFVLSFQTTKLRKMLDAFKIQYLLKSENNNIELLFLRNNNKEKERLDSQQFSVEQGD